jgi:hypothetical protein
VQKLPNVTLDTSASGFHNRNTLVSQSDYLMAFCFAGKNGNVSPTEGGTADTWNKSKTVYKVFIDLDTL